MSDQAMKGSTCDHWGDKKHWATPSLPHLGRCCCCCLVVAASPLQAPAGHLADDLRRLGISRARGGPRCGLQQHTNMVTTFKHANMDPLGRGRWGYIQKMKIVPHWLGSYIQTIQLSHGWEERCCATGSISSPGVMIWQQQ
jgi:hypothetical protein